MVKIQKKQKKQKKEKKITFQSPKGMHDILPEDQVIWEKIRQTAKSTAEFYNFSRIDTTLVESAELFERGVGADTDIVGKEMYFLKTKGNEKLVLRPEGTAPVVRAYYEHGLSRIGHPVKLYYIGPMFRYEQPQHGRFRMHHQIGFEILGGESDPIYDAQAITTSYRFLEEVKIKNINVHINSIGCAKCRPPYQRKLESYYKKYKKKICKDCQRRVDSNSLRLLDCKEEKCQPIKEGAPIMLDYLCHFCKEHFKKTLEYLDEIKIPYFINNYLVRGLDYYNRTVYEMFSEEFTFTIASGGRYDYLAETLALGKLSAVGGSIGIERVIEILKSKEKTISSKILPKIFFIHIGDEAKKKGLTLIEEFKKTGIKVSESFGRESLKSQLRVADKEKVEFVLILGQKEVFEESIIIRDMRNGVQENVPLHKVVGEVKRKIKQL
ncbi:histidine--tRNA ligase [Candidatus Wolfebacteria bacterium CG10_big_fil_rev_8_21_14_0_10_31_9]|uniref:Histidine--tRNA ligase n=1 Tax=Candidatus Wolfebacteria bacterium CG10_big_fil_rev_8_21_14_0_10_31_9 TaxID=1975070 RepID=A0A2H0RCW6_9BACT|nr:MAG: histidine--tRNA ligase [Candidatus Wolfebacteria bacterium CG10_big_fil_rev_8_21_14_0_10_31_9]